MIDGDPLTSPVKLQIEELLGLNQKSVEPSKIIHSEEQDAEYKEEESSIADDDEDESFVTTSLDDISIDTVIFRSNYPQDMEFLADSQACPTPSVMPSSPSRADSQACPTPSLMPSFQHGVPCHPTSLEILLPKEEQDKHRTSREASLQITTRQWCREKVQPTVYFIVSHHVFDEIVLGFILLNALFQALDDPTTAKAPQYQVVAEYIFTVVFSIELVMKNAAWGPKEYMKDIWNWLDAMVVAEGLYSISQAGSDGDTGLSALRTLRILRPLRTIKKFPSLRKVVVAILNSLGALTHIFLVFLLFLIMSSLFGVVLWSGEFTYRCSDEDGYYVDKLEESHNSVGILCGQNLMDDDEICRSFSFLDDPYTCEADQSCVDSGIDPFGVISFDNCLMAMLTLFQVTTLESWNEILFFTQMVMTKGTILFFVVFIIVGTYMILNLMIAAVLCEFKTVPASGAKEEERRRQSTYMRSRRTVSMLKIRAQSQLEIASSDFMDQDWLVVKCIKALRKTHNDFCKKHRLDKWCEQDRSWLNTVVYTSICLNMLVLAMEYHGSSHSYENGLEMINMFFSFLFLAEVVFKIVVLNPISYLSQWANFFDTIIVIGSMIEFGITQGESSGSTTVFRMVRMFRLFRVLRLARVSRRWERVKKAVEAIVHSAKGIAPSFLLLCLMWFVFAILGMELFGTVNTKDDRHRFDSFVWSLFQVFFITTGDGWSTIMYSVVSATSIASSLYFIILITVGQYLLLNLILAIILDGPGEMLNEKLRNQRIRYKLISITMKVTRRIAFGEWKAKTKEIERDLSFSGASVWDLNSTNLVFQTESRNSQSRKNLRSAFINKHTEHSEALERNFTKALNRQKGVRKKQQHKKLHITSSQLSLPQGYTQWSEIYNEGEKKRTISDLFGVCMDQIFGKLIKNFKPSPEQLKLQKLINTPQFYYFMIFIILLSTVLVLTDSAKEGGSSVAVAITLDTICTVIFIFEMVILIKAYTFWRGGKSAYFRCHWHQLDAFLIVASVISLLMRASGASAKALQTVAVLKSLRPLRLGSRMETFKDLLSAMLRSFEGLGTVATFIILMWFGYSIVGLQLFKGTFYHCSDPFFPEGAYRYGTRDEDGIWLTPPCSGVWIDPETGQEEKRDFAWQNAEFTFDNIFDSMWSLFSIMTVENWLQILWQAVDATKVDYQPKTNDNLAVFIFFFLAILMFGFYMTNLFIGVIFETYTTMKVNDHGHLIDMEEKRKREYEEHLSKKKYPRPPRIPEQRWRRPFFRLAKHPAFSKIVLAILVCNAAILLSENANESKSLSTLQQVANDIFAILFVLEASVLIIGLGPRSYFESKRNTFDFAITVVSIADTIFMSWVSSCSDSSGAILELIRALRIIRIVRLGLYVPGIRSVLAIACHPLEILSHVVFLSAVMIFTFANLGVLLFGHIEYDNTSLLRFSNFSDAPSAMILLFTVMTGEGWPDFMGYIDHNGNIPHLIVILYFFTFLVIMQFILVNFFVMLVVESFEILGNMRRREFENLIPSFKKVWTEVVDPQGKGLEASAVHLYELYLRLPPPMGLGPKASFLALHWRLDCFHETSDCSFVININQRLWNFSAVLTNMYLLCSHKPRSLIPRNKLYGIMIKSFAIARIYRWLSKYVHRWKRKEILNSSQASDKEI